MIVNDQFLDSKGKIDKDTVLAFFKANAVTTSSGLGNAGQMPKVSKVNIKERCDAFSGTGSEKPIRSAEFDAKVVQVNLNRTDKGEVQFERAGDSDRNTVGAYYLPWGGMFVMSMKLPADAASDFFFTAGLAGCSVFASGAATEPTIYHAGTEGKYAGDVAVFWEECIKAAANKQGLSDLGSLKGINKNNYMNDPQVEKFEKWLKSEVDTRLKVEHASPGGFVFGLRCNKEWEFYLQDRLVVETIEFAKKSKPDEPATPAPLPTKQSALVGDSVRQDPVKKTEKWGIFFTKEVEIGCNVVRVVSHPVSLRRFFPAGSFSANLVDKWHIPA